MAAAIASTRMESSKIDSAGVESGEKMLVGLIANGPPWRACRVLPFARPVPGGIRRRYGSEAHDGAADARRPDGSTIRDSAARARDSAALAGTWTSAARPADSAVMKRIGSSALRASG